MKVLLCKSFVPFFFALFALSGCSALNKKSDVEKGEELQGAYKKIDSITKTTSELNGSSIRSDNTTGRMDLHDISKIIIGNKTVVVDGKQGFSNNYDYVKPYSQSYREGGVGFSANGVYGIATKPEHMPKSGRAIYRGEATGIFVTATQGFDLSRGTSTVEADFATGKVNTTLNNFTAINQITKKIVYAPVDTIIIKGMKISSNGFSGGSVTTLKNRTFVHLTGFNTKSAAKGHFFGYDATKSQPDEVAGNVLLQGSAGKVISTFIAD